MKLLSLAGALVLALSATFAHADALEQLRSFAAQTKSARGEFTQRIIKSGKAGETSSGTFAFTRPGKFRWNYAKPYEQVLVADGVRLWIFDKDLNQVTVRKLGDALGESPAAILFGSSDLDKSFKLKDAGTHDGIDWLEATPRSKDSTFERVVIGFRNGAPEAMELHDAFGQVSQLSFRNFVRNPEISSDQFAFVPPKGADVYEQ